MSKFIQDRENKNFLSENPGSKNCITPNSLLVAHMIQGQKTAKVLHALFDTGSTKCFIRRDALPKGANPFPVEKIRVKTLQGQTSVCQAVWLSDVMLPEFSTTTRITEAFTAYVVEPGSMTYDVLLGQDFNSRHKIDILNSTQEIQWMDQLVPFQHKDTFKDPLAKTLYYLDIASPDSDPFETHHTDILQSKYDPTTPAEVSAAQKHLTADQQADLAKLLSKFDRLFSNKLGVYKGRKMYLELVENASPVHKRAYPVPRANLDVFKTELDRLVQIGVLSKCNASEWGSPTFIIPKKDKTVRWVSDFRDLNKVIKRKIYPLPRIQAILRKRAGYKFLTKLDISMQYYTFELTEESKDLCVIVTPFGKYRYERAPMGVSQTPDFAQSVMEEVLQDIAEIEVYLDDIGVFSNDWDSHLKTLDITLTKLQDAGFIVNPLKCEWAVQETDWLGHWLTPTGLKPWRKKIDAILALESPKNLRQVRAFIGAVTYYRDMFPKRSHLLAPLTELTGNDKKTGKKRKFIWTKECEESFQKMKAIMARDVLLRYPDHNKPYHVYTDASDYQLGAVIMQDGHPVAFYSRKLNSAQRNYTTMEKELLSIVETLREFRTMLFGCRELHVHTDHKNLTYANLTSQRVLRWRLFLEEFNPIFPYIKGDHNTLADALSRLSRQEGQSRQSLTANPVNGSNTANPCADQVFPDEVDADEPQDKNLAETSNILDDSDMLNCFLNLDEPSDEPFTLSFKQIAAYQVSDPELTALVQSEPKRYAPVTMSDGTIVIVEHQQYSRRTASRKDGWKIAVPDNLLSKLVTWYHVFLNHIGASRLHDTIGINFSHPQLLRECRKQTRSCDACQRYKPPGRGYAHTPARQALAAPFHEVAVDLIGPWKVTVNGQELVFNALTAIDTVTNLPEIIRVENKTAEHVARQFELSWLARYPRPMRVVYDQGGEFKGRGFKAMLNLHGIKPVPTTVKNPQANAICERMHQTAANALRILMNHRPPHDAAEAAGLMDLALQSAAYGIRAAVHGTMQLSPGAVVYRRDMLLDIPVVVDLTVLQQHRQAAIDHNLILANKKRISHDYAIGEKVLKLVYKPNKLEPRAEGPFVINKVHNNGTLTIQLSPTTAERLNVRRVRPYFE